MPILSFAQEDEFIPVSIGGLNSSAGANCFDYYKFGSLEIDIQPEKSVYQAGETVKFTGALKNNNDYPVIQGYLLIQIFREAPQTALTYGNNLIEEFFFPEELALNSKGEKVIKFEWNVPRGITGGSYLLATHFIVSKKMNLSGLSFVDGVYGGIARFQIESGDEISEVIIDRSNIRINGEVFQPRTFIHQFQTGDKIKIDFSLKNLFVKSQDITLSKKLFRWDNLLPEQIMQESVETIGVGSLSSKISSISFADLSAGVYLFEAVAENQGIKSILKVRFAVNGENPPARINFAALNRFPLEKNQSGYIFVCFHSVLDKNDLDGKMILNLKDKDGDIIANAEYQGKITPQMMAVKKDFVPKKEYNELWLDAFIYDKDGKVIDKASFSYNCSQFTEPVKISIKVEDGILKVSPFNLCNSAVSARLAIEVYDGKGEIVYFEPSFYGKEFKKSIEFQEGAAYKINAVSSGVKESISYIHSKKAEEVLLTKQIKNIFLVLIIVLIAGIVIFLIFKKFQKAQK